MEREVTQLGVVLAVFIAMNRKESGVGLKKTDETMATESFVITAEEAKDYMESHTDYALVDVRMPEEFAGGHIPGAVNIPLETILDERPAELTEISQMILVYCHGGSRSRKAAMRLRKMGYTKAYCFGGMDTWKGSIIR